MLRTFHLLIFFRKTLHSFIVIIKSQPSDVVSKAAFIRIFFILIGLSIKSLFIFYIYLYSGSIVTDEVKPRCDSY